MTEASQTGPWRTVQASVAVLVMGFFLFATRDVLNPVFLFLLFWAVLRPFKGIEGYSALVTVAVVVTLTWLLSTTGSLLAPFVLSMLIAYALDPLVDILGKRGVSRTVAILLLVIPALGALAVFFLLLLPAALQQLGEVIEEIPVFFERLAQWLEATRERLLRVDFPLLDEDALLDQLRSVDSGAVITFVQERQQAVGTWLWSSVLGVGRGIGSIFTVLGYVALTPVLTFYLLRDWDGLTASVADLFPRDRRDTLVAFAKECDHLVSRYLRGQVTVALLIGVLTGLGLGIARFPYAATLGLIVAVFSVVPYLGLILSLIPAVFIALVSGSVGISLLKVGIVYGAAQILEGTVISPRVVGESVGLHPVWVVLALALGGFFFGFVGLLIGVPIAAVTKLLIVRGLERYRGSDFYRGGSSRGGTEPV